VNGQLLCECYARLGRHDALQALHQVWSAPVELAERSLTTLANASGHERHA
jgi:hypothetical protein